MRKIPCLLVIDREAHVALDELNPAASFLLEAASATPTIKRDGTSTYLDTEGNWWARRAVKPGKTAPAGYMPLETDPHTGITFGWEPMAQSGFHKFHTQALAAFEGDLTPGTYELCGPKIGPNPEGLATATLFRHGAEEAVGCPPLTDLRAAGSLMDALRPYFTTLRDAGVEGVVWHVEGTPAVKLRVKDLFPELDRR